MILIPKILKYLKEYEKYDSFLSILAVLKNLNSLLHVQKHLCKEQYQSKFQDYQEDCLDKNEDYLFFYYQLGQRLEDIFYIRESPHSVVMTIDYIKFPQHRN